jgi:molybdopterin synthase sulfur carrier subunit
MMQILYFAWLREKIGVAEEKIDPPPEVTSVAALIAWLKSRGPGYAAAFADQKLVRCAVDQEFAAPDAMIAGAHEIAFFPPVTGG